MIKARYVEHAFRNTWPMTNEVIFYITKNNPLSVKTGKNIFSSVLGGYKMRTLTRKGLIQSSCTDATVCICSTKKVFIKISQISQQNTCGLHVCNFIKNRLQHGCFPVKFAKSLWSAFYRIPSVVASACKTLISPNKLCSARTNFQGNCKMLFHIFFSPFIKHCWIALYLLLFFS